MTKEYIFGKIDLNNLVVGCTALKKGYVAGFGDGEAGGSPYSVNKLSLGVSVTCGWRIGVFRDDRVIQAYIVYEGTNRILTDVVISIHAENDKITFVHPVKRDVWTSHVGFGLVVRCLVRVGENIIRVAS